MMATRRQYDEINWPTFDFVKRSTDEDATLIISSSGSPDLHIGLSPSRITELLEGLKWCEQVESEISSRLGGESSE